MIEEVINLRGIPLRLVDTAGIRESLDELEREGMERTRRQLERADLVLHVVDASAPRPPDGEGLNLPDGHRVLSVLNKADLGEHEEWRGIEGVRISCLEERGLAQLDEAIAGRINGGEAAGRDWSVAINARHKAALEVALRFLHAAREAMVSELSPEFVAEELRGALDAVGDVVGRADAEDVLGRIFATFCIGK